MKLQFDKLEKYRYRDGLFGSNPGNPFGMFRIPGPIGRELLVCASTGLGQHVHGWEHVSVSASKHCPTWREMCFIKDLFWAPEEVVMQLHPGQADWVSNHARCLHLWRPTDVLIPLPPPAAVGVQALGDLEKNPITPVRAMEIVAKLAEEADRITGVQPKNE
ncbi:MAG TPA: hypothetical protein VF760_02095 [Xanthobacteraceae bacterium]